MLPEGANKIITSSKVLRTSPTTEVKNFRTAFFRKSYKGEGLRNRKGRTKVKKRKNRGVIMKIKNIKILYCSSTQIKLVLP